MLANPGSDGSDYLALGDSYTIGEGALEVERWPVQLAGLLRDSGTAISNPDIIAHTGWTTAELQEAIEKSGNQKTYELVSLLIGVNNQYRGQSRARYRAEFRALLQTAIQFAGGRASRVFVLSIPDWGVSPFASDRDRAKIAQEIDQFNAIAQEECRRAAVAFVDITPTTRRAASEPTPGVDSQFTSDGLHYSGKQMRQWAELALPVVSRLLVS
ncbi:lysophospholipase [Spirosoma montaniterrae]|uniref:Lysophospholipase n=1 Tax=Spirosoma montaniterrae TaxID=1178516 RepID=A0A1P9X4Z9_9BACT|nr:SGNH/GDSL hydrolase family protein [Spirosoma montaniterrae]AQG82687.1 lysophospholipase [Spirosoma montaniterrae]